MYILKKLPFKKGKKQQVHALLGENIVF